MYTYVLLSDFVCAVKSLCSLEVNHRYFLSTSSLCKHLRLHLYLGCQERTFTDVAEQTEEGEKNEKQDGMLVQHDQDGLQGKVCWETGSRETASEFHHASGW